MSEKRPSDVKKSGTSRYVRGQRSRLMAGALAVSLVAAACTPGGGGGGPKDAGGDEKVDEPCECQDGVYVCSMIEQGPCPGADAGAPDASMDAGLDAPDASMDAAPDAEPSVEVAPGPPGAVCAVAIHGPGRQLISDVAVAKDGRIAVVGALFGSADFGGGVLTNAGKTDGFIAVYDAACKHLFSARYGSAEDETVVEAAFDGAGNLIVGCYNFGVIDFGEGPITPAGESDFVVAKLDTSYKTVYAKGFGGPAHDYIGDLRADAAGNAYIGGTFCDTFDLGGPPLVGPDCNQQGTEMYLGKLGPMGEHVWSKVLTTTNSPAIIDNNYLNRLAVDDGGNIALVGIVRNGASVDLGGGPVAAMGPNVNGHFSFAGRLTTDGQHVWSRAFPVRGNYGVALAPNGEVFSAFVLDNNGPTSVDLGTGIISGSAGVARLSSIDGATIWSQGYTTGFPYYFTIAATAPGGVLMAGGFEGSLDFGGGALLSSAGSADLFAARLGADGSHLYSLRFGDDDKQYIATVAHAEGGRTIMAGSYYGSISFMTGTMTDFFNDSEDAFIVVFEK
jgi:hypothetical protein